MKVRWVFWVFWGLIGLALEVVALANEVPNDTLSGTVSSHVPAWIAWVGVGWLAHHALVIYLNRRDEK
ncbi:MAG: hypothetical protein ACREKH_04985 [Candidatus Rokuibacteriota bacterium]